jgi:hypothetical protein
MLCIKYLLSFCGSGFSFDCVVNEIPNTRIWVMSLAIFGYIVRRGYIIYPSEIFDSLNEPETIQQKYLKND